MRTFKTVLLVMLALVAVVGTGWAKSAKSLIIGSAHDLSAPKTKWSGYTYQPDVCFFCHIMHKTGATGSTTGPGYLLWNQTISSVPKYGVYSSESFNAVIGAASVADLGNGNTFSTLTVSNLCLSCHDGTIAVATVYESVDGLPGQGINEGTNHIIIEDLTKTHPVNFLYGTALVTAYGVGLHLPANTNKVDTAGEIPLFNGYLQCATCHDVHNGASSAATGTFPFARNFNATVPYQVCTTCHNT